MKRFFSLILALTLALSMSGAVFAHALETTTTAPSCEHQFACYENTTSHWEQCSICGYRQNEQAHNFEMCVSAAVHYSVCNTCGHMQNGNKHLFENGACTVCGYADELVAHKCTIVRATESYHRYECDECENYTRVLHDETTMEVIIKNEFFHSYECADCKYAYTERHDFRTGYDSTGHYDKCVDCGYKTETVEHVIMDDFHGCYHDVECEDCAFNVTRHIGVKYTPVDESNCQATCSECATSVYVEHEWSNFTCDNCGYQLDGYTIGLITEINYSDEYYVYFLTADGDEEVFTLPEWRMWDIAEGDVIRVDHYGNTIWGIDVLVDCDVLDDVDNFENYVSPYISEKDAGLIFDDLLAYHIEYFEQGVDVYFCEGTRSVSINTQYVVYDLYEGEISDLEEDCAYITYFAEDLVYFFCIW